VTGSALTASARDEEHLALLRELGLSACVIVPMLARGRVFGALTFVTGANGTGFRDFDIPLAEDLARRAAMALDNAHVHRAGAQSRHAVRRMQAEVAVRTKRLQSLYVALSEALSEEDVSIAVFRYAFGATGAANGLIGRLSANGEHFDVMYVEAMIGALEHWRSFPVTARTPIGDVARTGQPIFLESREAWAARYPEHLPLLEAAGHHANAVLPLVGENGRVIGVFGAAYTQPQTFGDDERAVAKVVVQQCARALERAYLRDGMGPSEAVR
jgi:GAF domain-containing protein